MTIQRHDVSWMCERVKGFEVFLDAQSSFAAGFKAGGYIAGGSLRVLLRAGTVDILPAFFRNFGDIDVFCPNKNVYDEIKKGYSSWEQSLGKNAEQCTIHLRRCDPLWNLINNDCDFTVILQLVNILYHEPVTMLETFDIANCKIAFDGRSIYVDDRVESLERDQVLQLDMSSATLGARVEKYFRKHGYRTLHPESKGILMKWLMERYENQDWGRILRGEQVVPKLMMLGSSVIPDDALIRFIGKFKHDIKSANYGEMMHSTLNGIYRECMSVDVATAELNRRRITCTIKPGDLVEIYAHDPAWNSCILLGRDAAANVWHVLFTNGQVSMIHEYGIIRVVSSIGEAK